MLAKKTAKNQLTLPKAVVARFQGVDYFEVSSEGDSIILRPLRRSQADAARERLAELGITEEDVAAAVTWARQNPVIPRVVFDTNTVISALLFPRGRLAWLRWHWRDRECVPLISKATAAELDGVLRYPKFRLDPQVRLELIGEYLPYCEIVEVARKCSQACRDPYDQQFLDLALCGSAEVLVTGDEDLLVLADSTSFKIQSPEQYRNGLPKT